MTNWINPGVGVWHVYTNGRFVPWSEPIYGAPCGFHWFTFWLCLVGFGLLAWRLGTDRHWWP